MTQHHQIEDLGEPASGDTWMNWRFARHPTTGAELALGSLSRGGFVVIDPVRQTAIQVRPEQPFVCGWAVGQAPNGDIYQCDYGGPLCVWDWKNPRARTVADHPMQAVFTLDVAADGRVYLPNYSSNTLWRFTPSTGKIESLGDFHAFGGHIRNVFCAHDGWVYLTCTSYSREQGEAKGIVAFDPQTGEKSCVKAAGHRPTHGPWNGLTKDAAGHVLMSSDLWGRVGWHELIGGCAQAIDPQQVRITQGNLPLAFTDGSYIKKIEAREVTRVDAHGRESRFEIKYEDSPVSLFSVAAGAGKIWCGTFIPLTLISFDPATGQTTRYGNPTKTGGEIYNMVFSKGRLYMASYTGATITRYDPARPWRKDDSIHANPAHLGLIKETGLPLQRPHGKADDPDGNVYFAAHGGYGCYDSGICRIDPVTDHLTSWIYPNTSFNALIFLRGSGQLLVAERRGSENAIRFTFIAPGNGAILWSEPVIPDQGEVVSWLDSGGDLVFGVHSYRATLFAFSLSRKKVVAELREMRVGTHCYNALFDGPDGRIWGLTNQGVYAVTRDLKQVEVVAGLPAKDNRDFYKFGFGRGPDGAIYFPSGTHLMRLKI